MSVIEFFKDLFATSPEQKKNRALKKIVRKLAYLHPPVINEKTEDIHPKFVYFLLNTIRPLIGIIPTFKEELEVKKGQGFIKYILEKKIDKKVVLEMSVFNSEESILNLSKESEMTEEKMIIKLNEVVKNYNTYLSPQVKQNLNICYSDVCRLMDLRDFDFLNFFREFDSSYEVNKSPSLIRFRSKEVEIFTQDFMLLDKVFGSIGIGRSFLENVFDYSEFVGREIEKGKLNQVFKNITFLNTHKIFFNLINFGKKSFDYRSAFKTNLVIDFNHLIQSFLQKARAQISNIYKRKKQLHSKELSGKLFSGVNPPSLAFYNLEQNNFLQGQSIGKAFLKYVYEINLVYGFLVARYAEEIKPLIDMIVVKGDFNQEEMRKSSNDAFFQLNDLVTLLGAFDQKMSDEGEFGIRLKRLATTYKPEDSQYHNILKDFVAEIDEEAKEIVKISLTAFKVIFFLLKNITETHQQQSRQCLRNISDFAGAKTSLIVNNKMKTALNYLKLFFHIIKNKP